MRVTIDDKHLSKWMWVKKYAEKRLFKMFLTEDEVMMGEKHWPKYQCEIFNVVDLCSGVGIVWLTTTRTRVSDATAVTFSVKCFNPLKLYRLSENISRKWFASYFLFIHEHLIIMWSPTVNLIAVTTFTDVRFTPLLAINKYLRIQIILCC